MRLRLLAAVAATFMSITSAVNAATAVNIQASGTFGANVDTTSLSSPSASWSLSLTVLNPPTGGTTSYADPPTDTIVTDFFIPYDGSTANNDYYGLGATYVLNGSTVAADPVVYLDFYSPIDGGGVDFGFKDGTTLSLYLGDIGSDGTISTGSFSILDDVNDEYAIDPIGHSALNSSGTLTITSTTVQPVPPPPPPVGTVPEPATWAFMVLGLGLVGIALRRRPLELAA